jgi:GH15 family glucan-1,4-alpha-glucosidase
MPDIPQMDVNSVTNASVAAILANQHASGAFVASPDFSQYDYCWLRDASFVAAALDRAAEHDASRRYHEWVARVLGAEGIGPLMETATANQRTGRETAANELPPARFSLDGRRVSDDWPNFQLDGYGTWLWALDLHLRSAGTGEPSGELRGAVERTARYLSVFALQPCFDVWEENPGEVHTSTLASIQAGLRCAASLLDEPALTDSAAKVFDAITVSAREPGRFVKSNRQQTADGSLLWTAPVFNVVANDDPCYRATVEEIQSTLIFDGGVRRYASDTYFGGGSWPVLTCSLGLHHAQVGDIRAAERCLDWSVSRLDEHGRLGEQFGGETRDPEHYREWVARWGHPARNLVWSHAMCVLLAIEIEAASHTRGLDSGPHQEKGKERGYEEEEQYESALPAGDEQ